MEFPAQISLPLTDCLEIRPPITEDERGCFVKTFEKEWFRQHGLPITFTEEYFTVSHKNVLRGMHFQVPPKAMAKLVYCIHGKVLDVLLDLRQGSPSFGETASVILSSHMANMVFMPEGIAHGFYVLDPVATVVYKTTTDYSPNHDTGILWNSIPFDWPADAPVLSSRDKGFPALQDFQTPFRYQP